MNTGNDEVAALGELFAGIPIKINLIDVNDRPSRWLSTLPPPTSWRNFATGCGR